MCAVIPEPDPEQLHREEFHKVMRMHMISGACKRPASHFGQDADQGFNLVDGTLGFPFCNSLVL